MNKRILFVTLLFILTYAVSLAAQLANYTLADVAKHNSSTDCWIILNKTEVYNVTPLLIDPPGRRRTDYSVLRSRCHCRL